MKKLGVKYVVLSVILSFLLIPFTPFAQSSSDETEVYLSFRHRGVINSMVTAYYKDGSFFLPVGEIFSLFQIDYEIQGLVISGFFSTEQVPYSINLQANTITFGDETYSLTQDDYLLKELDNYLHPALFNEIFGLSFTIDFNNLSLNLETNVELPAIASALRSQRRHLANNNRYEVERYDLRYGRERPFLDGGFVDYNLSGSYSPGNPIFNFNSNIGLQLYGGDFQGVAFGNYSSNNVNFATSNMRWRYRYVDNPILSTLVIGQTTTDGITRNNYTGIRLSNNPIEPRRLFDEFEIQGTTIPEAEVELYLNNALIDFQEADELGDYRFLAPVSYGSSQLDLKIYGPTGRVIERSRRIQIPFTFQPQGIFNYQINAGRLNNPIFGSTEQNLTAQANGAYGITNWLTAKAGVEYYQGYHQTLPTFTTTLSSRILSNYLFTLEAASEAYYRGALNVIYPNAASFNFDYTTFNSGTGIYNPSNDDERIIVSAFYPFNVFGRAFNLRASTYSRIRNSTNTTTFRFNTGTRLGKLNLRFGYSDRLVNTLDVLNPTDNSYLETSATYNISRNRSLPAYLRGVYLRAQMRYFPSTKRVESMDFVASQNFFKMGRLQLSYERNFIGNYNLFRFSLVLDLGILRSSTSGNINRNNFSTTQNIRGSIGFDSNYNNFVFTSRDQVGRAGTAIKLFVDNNANSIFDKGDKSIPGNAIRIQRSGASSITKNEVLYYTQMQPYFFYNMEVNKGAILNPMLVPQFEKFGVITDPNRFKQIEIPFYMSGVIEGMVERQYSEGRTGGIGGLKLNLEQLNGSYSEEIRTFSDGGFYSFEVPPGKYVLSVDSTQLEILDAISEPDSLLFEVRAIPEGDFVEGLLFLLKDKVVAPTVRYDSLQTNACRYGIQLAAFSTAEMAKSFKEKSQYASEAYILYNRNYDLYAVRLREFNNFGEATQFARKLYSQEYSESSVFMQCYGPDVDLTAKRYELQIAAFSNPHRAKTYVDDINTKYDLDAYQVRDNKSLLYKVKLGPFNTLEQALDKMNEIESTTTISDFIITDRDIPVPEINVDFTFIVQLGEFNITDEALAYAQKIENEFGYNATILIDEHEGIQLVLRNINSWMKAVRIKNQISGHSSFATPVIHLLETKL